MDRGCHGKLWTASQESELGSVENPSCVHPPPHPHLRPVLLALTSPLAEPQQACLCGGSSPARLQGAFSRHFQGIHKYFCSEQFPALGEHSAVITKHQILSRQDAGASPPRELAHESKEKGSESLPAIVREGWRPNPGVFRVLCALLFSRDCSGLFVQVLLFYTETPSV